MPVEPAVLEERLRNIEALEQQGKIRPENAKSLKDEALRSLALMGKGALQTAAGVGISGLPNMAAGGAQLVGAGIKALPEGAARGAVNALLPGENPSQLFAAPADAGGYNPVEPQPQLASDATQAAAGPAAPARSPTYSRFDKLLAGQSAGVMRQTRATQAAIDEATGKRAEAIEMEAEAGKAQAQAEYAYRDEAAKQEAAAQAKFEQEQAEIRTKQEEMQRDIQGDIDELGGMKVTDRRNLAQKIGGAIAIGLGAYAATVSGGRNYALDIVNKQIDDDIAMQRSEIETKKSQITGKQNAYQRLRDKLGDSNAAYQAVRAGYLDQVKNQLSQIALKHKGTQIEARATSMMAEVEQQSALAKQQAFMGAADQVRANTQLRIQAQQQADSSDIAYAKALGDGGGKQLPAARAEALGKLGGSIADVDRLMANFEKLTGPESVVSQFIPGSKTKFMDNQLKVFTVMLVNSLSGAQVSDREIERYVAMIPKVTNWDSTAMNQLRALKLAIGSKYQSIKDVYAQTNWDVSKIPDVETGSLEQLGRDYEG